jgi:hypothetical protein
VAYIFARRGKRMTGGLRSSGGYQDGQHEKQSHRAEDNDLLNNASIESPHLSLLQSHNSYCE